MEPFGWVVASPLCDSQAEGRVTAREHSVGGTMLETCAYVGNDAFAAAYAWAKKV